MEQEAKPGKVRIRSYSIAGTEEDHVMEKLIRERDPIPGEFFAGQLFFTTREVAERLKLKEELVRELIRNGDLHAYRIGKAYRIAGEDIEEFLRQRSTRKNDVRVGGDG